jgi:hypothetical protein
VLLLSNGLLMYQGPTAQLVPWFSIQLGFTYEPERHGAASDWVLDLLALGFAKPKVGGLLDGGAGLGARAGGVDWLEELCL